jgi:uncharacterized protein (DUF2141 family)
MIWPQSGPTWQAGRRALPIPERGEWQSRGVTCAYNEADRKIMSKSSIPFAIGGLIVPAALGAVGFAAPAGASTGCAPGRPSVIVHVAGLKQSAGEVKVSLYGSDTDRWLARGGKIGRIKVPVTARAMDICVPVPAPGRYAVAVHHDYNVNGERDREDGGGYSRDPKVSLLNPKPPFAKAAFEVGNGPARVGVTMLYIKGLGVGPSGR